MKKFILLLSAIFLMAVSYSTALAAPWPTYVQFSPMADKTIQNIFPILEFDWSSSGDLVIKDALVSSSTGDTSLSGFFANGARAVGDTIQFRAYAQARLAAFNDPLLAGIAGNFGLNNTGSDLGASDYEVTGVLDLTETAKLLATGGGIDTLQWTGISGTFAYYLDRSVDSVIATGAGFTDSTNGLPFMSGNVVAVLPTTFTSDGSTFGAGSAFIRSVVTAYDPTIIDAWPVGFPGVQLVGTTFDSTITFGGSLEPRIGVGGIIGQSGYTVLAEDLRLKGDADSQFSAIPEPGTMVLLGLGLIGIAGIARRKK